MSYKNIRLNDAFARSCEDFGFPVPEARVILGAAIDDADNSIVVAESLRDSDIANDSGPYSDSAPWIWSSEWDELDKGETVKSTDILRDNQRDNQRDTKRTVIITDDVEAALAPVENIDSTQYRILVNVDTVEQLSAVLSNLGSYYRQRTTVTQV